jgi:hypothetical protein
MQNKSKGEEGKEQGKHQGAGGARIEAGELEIQLRNQWMVERVPDIFTVEIGRNTRVNR